MKLLSLLNPKILVLTLKTVLIETWRVCWIVSAMWVVEFLTHAWHSTLLDYL